MKNKIRYFFMFSIFFLMGIVSINLFQPDKEQQIRGNIEFLVSENSYDYLVECANKFMKQNDKTFINIKKVENFNQIADNVKQNTKVQYSNIVQIDRVNFDNLKLDNYNKFEKLLDNYANNFAKYRVVQVKEGDNSIGIPINSRPLAFYIREDMLKQYGYKREDINTWSDVVKIGKDIYTRSNGEMSIINGIGQDYEDLLSLLIMENMSNDKDIDKVKLEVKDMIKQLKDNNILNLENEGEFLGRISSINAMKEIMAVEENCEWSIGNVPSINPGTNKFFAGEGDNLVVLNQNTDNEKLIEKFITYLITNNDETVKYVKRGNFFSSYLNTYRSTEIEEPINNFIGKSPLVVLSNIEEKTLLMDDYDTYIKIKQELKVQ